jgi:hypothetical protein
VCRSGVLFEAQLAGRARRQRLTPGRMRSTHARAHTHTRTPSHTRTRAETPRHRHRHRHTRTHAPCRPRVQAAPRCGAAAHAAPARAHARRISDSGPAMPIIVPVVAIICIIRTPYADYSYPLCQSFVAHACCSGASATTIVSFRTHYCDYSYPLFRLWYPSSPTAAPCSRSSGESAPNAPVFIPHIQIIRCPFCIPSIHAPYSDYSVPPRRARAALAATASRTRRPAIAAHTGEYPAVPYSTVQ